MKKNWQPTRAEFYETAVSMGFYGKDEGGLIGKKDNVRKFWEDIFIKLISRRFVENILTERKKVRILDLGSGSGEGYELLTRIPATNPKTSVVRETVLRPDEIEEYTGIDISPGMVSQGKANYSQQMNVSFELGNLEDGIPDNIRSREYYDVYFSSFGSLSHLHPDNFGFLLEQIFAHARSGSILIFDVLGKYSPEWPCYWSEGKKLLPYNMAYLIPESQRKQHRYESFDVAFWAVDELKNMVISSAERAGVGVSIHHMLDRSIFIGRHMDTGIFNKDPQSIRYQVNKLLDHNYRGDVEQLKLNLSSLEPYRNINPASWEKLENYSRQWNRVIYLLEALLHHDDIKVRDFIENTDIEQMSDELKFITWLFRNSDRFPVVDFWASIIGPQVAVVLRNLEMSYAEGTGCGHGLTCVIEIIK